VAERKDGTVKLSVFKGREAKLNWVIFQILAHESPLTIYEVCKRIKTKTGLKHVKYTNINRRVRALSDSGYLEEVGTRKTQAGFQANLYKMTSRAYLAIILNELDLDYFVQTATEEQITAVIAALMKS
jgi:hypothetical protein